MPTSILYRPVFITGVMAVLAYEQETSNGPSAYYDKIKKKNICKGIRPDQNGHSAVQQVSVSGRPVYISEALSHTLQPPAHHLLFPPETRLRSHQDHKALQSA